ncbi:hypothetical protein MM239_10315 [Belliella sp. DSM 111904]|uniref:Uncharacterized protein n=1 Tax=Belliella filtrata TaxID=2923435 RepID=A0ABS9V055_9BACT|nr:hypothetical protein [Belliella filtrata]MCH7409788.1 hypothetical protein [Belliella filtrata]
MKKIAFPILFNLLVFCLFACGQSQSSQNEDGTEQATKNSKSQNFNACEGIKESDFRKIFKVPEDYQLGDVSAFNIMPESSCVMAVGKEGQQLAVMVSIMANPSTFDMIANRVIEEFKTAPEEDHVSGLGEFAVFKENRTRKESALVVVDQKHIVSVAFDHSKTYPRDQVKGMLQDFYKQWRKLQK